MAQLELAALRKSFAGHEVIHGIDLKVEDGEFCVFVGPSGCGKSTLLRMIAGLETVTSGEIRLNGDRCDHLLPASRGMAMVFQSYALFPHMSVRENLRFGLVCQKVPNDEIARRIDTAAELLHIGALLDRRPSQLSGGQSQRVAIGRAIVLEPSIFLFDEPLSNLDAELRVRMRVEITRLHERLGSTMVYVTHDQVEAMTMADRIAVLRDGKVEQHGTPLELYARPANRFVAGFLGTPHMNLWEVGCSGRDGRAFADFGADPVFLPIAPPMGPSAIFGIRPEHLFPSEDGPLQCVVETSEILGGETNVHLTMTGGTSILARLPGICRVAPGASMRLGFNPAYAHLFDPGSGAALTPLEPWESIYVNEFTGVDQQHYGSLPLRRTDRSNDISAV